jgi:hypothetical protein
MTSQQRRCGMTPQRVNLSRAEWQKSTRSGSNGGQCVEVARNLPGVVAVHDSGDPEGTNLVFTRENWKIFTSTVKS